MKNKQSKRAYTRPEIEISVCEYGGMIAATIRNKGDLWKDGETIVPGFTDSSSGPDGSVLSSSFRFRSVWDAPLDELWAEPGK